MRMRLASMLELIAVVATPMAIVRWVARGPGVMEYLSRANLLQKVGFFGEPILAGLALAGGVGLWVEMWLQKSPKVWGFGRWVWSVAAMTVALATIGETAIWTSCRWMRGETGSLREEAIFVTRNLLCTRFHSYAVWAFAGAWMTSRLAGRPTGPAPDAREWSGRVFMFAIVVWTVINRVLEAGRY
jgi:hypothetical protein